MVCRYPMSRHSWLGKALLAGWLVGWLGLFTNWSQTGTPAAFLIAARRPRNQDFRCKLRVYSANGPRSGRLQQASLLRRRLGYTRGLEKGKSGKLQRSRTVVGYCKDEIVLYKAKPSELDINI
ncbi:hypothetical protein GGR55DRAFT_211339 [Xylaria sp. FL0064]|nr:hypothetical protein GGR55DRAFT_211339 [Xylaria sp. FL0064]